MPGAARPRSLLGALPLLLLLAGCSGTPFGEALSRSFSGVVAQPAPSPTPSPSPTPAPPARPGAPAATAPRPSPAASAQGAGARSPLTPASPAPAPTPSPPRSAAPSTPTNPAPYRVTLRLPQADSAAPAEGLTRALRAAGVPFEVEAIERLPPGSPPASMPSTGTATPAPSAGAPLVRPAPLPR